MRSLRFLPFIVFTSFINNSLHHFPGRGSQPTESRQVGKSAGGRIQTHNLHVRTPGPYPLGHHRPWLTNSTQPCGFSHPHFRLKGGAHRKFEAHLMYRKKVRRQHCPWKCISLYLVKLFPGKHWPNQGTTAIREKSWLDSRHYLFVSQTYSGLSKITSLFHKAWQTSLLTDHRPGETCLKEWYFE